ncbi:MAG: N-acetyltransferase, partial [Firmicutes bacterium]|nr:N-acetyltransferase [Bacillota bacterium]
MQNSEIILRPVTEKDAAEILAIYAPYIENTAITFEYEVPSLESFEARIRGITAGFPYIAAVKDSRIIGYAYAKAYHERAAYARTVELSIYLHPDCKGCGTGRRLYNALAQALKLQGILNMVVSITDSADKDDQHNTNDSISFHTRMGFSLIGTMNRCGYKFGKWYNVVYMEKFLGEHNDNPSPIKT